MTFAEIEKLLEKGFTPEQITAMSQTGAQSPAPGTVQDTQTGAQTQTPAPGTVAPGTVAPGTVAPGTVAPGTVAPGTVQETQTQTQDQTPTWAATLNESIQSLKRTMQAAALAGSSQAAPVSTEDAASAVLASIIAPTFKKEDK